MHMCGQQSFEKNQTEIHINTIFISVLSKIKFTKNIHVIIYKIHFLSFKFMVMRIASWSL